MVETNIPPAPEVAGAEHLHSGKVRDLYRLTGGPYAGNLLMVASDRLSAFDFVLDTPITDKGRILTRMSLWWFDRLRDHLVGLENHVLSTDVPPDLAGRAVICESLEMIPVECVVRGYLTGSGLRDYAATGGICGTALPEGLVDGSRLPEPIFTPTTKGAVGQHDQAMTFEEVVDGVGNTTAQALRRLTLQVYGVAERLARDRGIILADTKLEFGARPDGTIVLADEVLTPDSSRYWPTDQWQPGRAQPSFDKDIVRNWLLSQSGWDRLSGEPPPPLPPEVIRRTRGRYIEAFELLSGEQWA